MSLRWPVAACLTCHRFSLCVIPCQSNPSASGPDGTWENSLLTSRTKRAIDLAISDVWCPENLLNSCPRKLPGAETRVLWSV